MIKLVSYDGQEAEIYASFKQVLQSCCIKDDYDWPSLIRELEPRLYQVGLVFTVLEKGWGSVFLANLAQAQLLILEAHLKAKAHPTLTRQYLERLNQEYARLGRL